jgi:hypothetical protein
MTRNIDMVSTTSLYNMLIELGYSDDYLNSITRQQMIEELLREYNN